METSTAWVLCPHSTGCMVRVSTLAPSLSGRRRGGEGFCSKSREIALVKETPRVKEAQQWDGLTGE